MQLLRNNKSRQNHGNSDFTGMIFWGKQGLFYKRPFHNSITDFRKYPPTKISRQHYAAG